MRARRLASVGGVLLGLAGCPGGDSGGVTAPPDAGAPGGPGMFALSDPDHVRGLLTNAGFEAIDVVPFDTSMLLAGGGTLDETIEFLLATGIGRAMLDQAEPDARARAVDAVRTALAAHHHGDGVRLGAATWIVTARKAG